MSDEPLGPLKRLKEAREARLKRDPRRIHFSGSKSCQSSQRKQKLFTDNPSEVTCAFCRRRMARPL